MLKPVAILDLTSPDDAPAGAHAVRAGLVARLGAETSPPAGEAAGLIGRLVSEGKLPVVLAATCDVALAAASSVAGRGRMGLAYIDGHSDFRHDANAIPPRRAMRSELARLTGRMADGARLAAHFRDEDTATIGFKRDDEAFVELRQTAILLWPMYWLYEHSRIDLEQSLARRFDRPELDGTWIHLDLDALDPALLPGIATPIDDGMSVTELVPILRTLLATGKIAGISVANLTPALLADAAQTRVVIDALADAFEAEPAASAP